ncbi:hypothetical protein NX059_004232 [Plenodomus lindquistii]|nr:hypothetical protein NX059_004232 [Plenodomus lindquistii]
MTSFKFPPPPPPPPKASSNDVQQAYGSQRGGSGRGGGDRGRGRGGGSSRGTGMHSSGGNTRGGHGQDSGRGGRGRGGARGGPQHQRGGGQHQRGGHNAGYGQSQPHQSSTTSAPPAQAYINPAFMNQSQGEGQSQTAVDPNALAQVMSFMSTPAGVQSMAAFASQMTNGGNAATQGSPRDTQATPRYSPQQHAGQKRKLGDRNTNTQSQAPPSQQSTKPPRAKAAVPPPVPSFGFSLPAPSAAQAVPASNTKSKKEQKKRKLNLGLSDAPLPAEQPISDAEVEEEDVDEEAQYAQKLKGGGFAFEHEGEQITIRTAAEVAAWIKDRRKNFPTKQRVVEKAQEKASKRASELEFLRKLKGAPPKPQVDTKQEKPRDDAKKSEEDIKGQAELAALRKKLHQSMLDRQPKAKPSTIDLGLGYDSDSSLASDAESSVVSSSSSDSPCVSSSEDEESEPEADTDNEAPTPTSSKVAPRPITLAPPGPKINTDKVAEQQRGTKICENWRRTGRCSFSNKCRYAHPPKDTDGQKGRGGGVWGVGMSLYERMVEQELCAADARALEAIKYLGQNGFLG